MNETEYSPRNFNFWGSMYTKTAVVWAAVSLLLCAGTMALFS
jgi:hypothetical protein